MTTTVAIEIEGHAEEVSLLIDFDHHRAEKATLEYPGFEAGVTVNSATDVAGHDCWPVLTYIEREQVIDACWEAVEDERARNVAE
jgi:hypothetical protein